MTSIRELQDAVVRRSAEWDAQSGQEMTLPHCTNELAGEVGEAQEAGLELLLKLGMAAGRACNAAKKITSAKYGFKTMIEETDESEIGRAIALLRDNGFRIYQSDRIKPISYVKVISNYQDIDEAAKPQIIKAIKRDMAANIGVTLLEGGAVVVDEITTGPPLYKPAIHMLAHVVVPKED